ncbi:MAG TPA: TIGR02206 family membrane protein [Anaerolineales bacterium]|nr:TIGR02206 family membrane protein [Anaerolineales bacterium]
MSGFFARDYTGGAFEFLGTTHLAALGALVLLNLYLFRFRHLDEKHRGPIRWTLALILWGNEFAWHYWRYSVGTWTIQTMLPLHLCSLLVWAGGLMLVTKNYSIYEFMYLAGIGGAIQALVTPDLGIYGFPHFRFFQTFISHGLIITSAIYMTVVERYRPTRKSLLRIAIWLNIYAVIVFFINTAIGSNYLMINEKPATASLLDLLPDWPVYILYMEVLGVVIFLLLYLPFGIRDWLTARDINRDNASRLESISK